MTRVGYLVSQTVVMTAASMVMMKDVKMAVLKVDLKALHSVVYSVRK